ncbi:hypothetical protein C8R44DRAFT_892146 [Mycena epipterygia]|nr:hypothetical protein C8R44DRAFT_892146 [Mycena epipterygia]
MHFSMYSLATLLSVAVSATALPSWLGIKPGSYHTVDHQNFAAEAISHVKFRQDAAVSAYIIAKWLDPKDVKPGQKDLGPWKAIDTEETFSLKDEGIPDGALIHFASYVSAVGEYENDHWFKVDYSAGKGADFRQTGTAFKGWFDYTGLFDFFRNGRLLDHSAQWNHPVYTGVAHGNFMSDSIATVKFQQDAAVSAYLVVHWVDPRDNSAHQKELGSWMDIGTQAEFNLAKEGVPDGANVWFTSYVAAVGEYTNDASFIADSSAHVDEVLSALARLQKYDDKKCDRLRTLHELLAKRRQLSAATTLTAPPNTKPNTNATAPALANPNLSGLIAHARAGLVQELVDVFNGVGEGGRPPLGGKAHARSEWTIGDLILPVPRGVWRNPLGYITAVLGHAVHFMSLLSWYLGARLPFAWAREVGHPLYLSLSAAPPPAPPPAESQLTLPESPAESLSASI